MHSKKLNLVVDMNGCPNRCKHCWLGHMPNKRMEDNVDQYLIDYFKPYFNKISYYSWLREPDYCDDYKERWQRDKDISIGELPVRYELGSFYRLVRDKEYGPFLKEVGTKIVQLTFFGMEEKTDYYIGRKGAFKELLEANEILLKNQIAPRWQVFINEENKEEILELLRLSEKLNLKERCAEIGQEFSFFIHAGSADGENRNLYDIRICKEHIPEELKPYYWDYESICTEAELCEKLEKDNSFYVPHNEDKITLLISNNTDVYFNFTHMTPGWKIGNLYSDPKDTIIEKIVNEDIAPLKLARKVTVGELVRKYGDRTSHRAFHEEDYKSYLLNKLVEDEII